MRNRKPLVILITLALSIAGVSRAQEAQPDETLPGFKANDVLGSGPVDHVDVYSGDPRVVVPLGPLYRLSTTFSWQLTAYNSVHFWHMYEDNCIPNNTAITRAFVRGTPALGAGWSIGMGYVAFRGLGLAPFISLGPVYVSPDGAQHLTDSSGKTFDGTRLLVSCNSGPTSCTVKFPDGITQTFTQVMAKPEPGNLTSPDFDFGDVAGNILGMTSLADKFSTLMSVSYTGTNSWRISQITLEPNSGSPKAITFNWNTPTSDWPTLSSIVFPALGTGNENVAFTYHGGGSYGITRVSADTTQDCDCDPSEYSPATAGVPLLETITLKDGPSTVAGTYSMCYDIAGYGSSDPCFNVATTGLTTGILTAVTTPTGARAKYQYAIGPGPELQCGNFPPPDLETTDSPNCGAAAPALAPGACSVCRVCKMVGSSPAVTTRTLSVSGVADRVTTYTRTNWVPSGYPTTALGTGYLTRVVTVVEPTDASQSKTTRYLFHNIDRTGSPTGTVGGMELEHSISDTASFSNSPVRTVVDCADTGGSSPQCGYLDDNGAPLFFANVVQNSSGAVTWFGLKPPSASGGDCPTAAYSTACLSSTSPLSSWDPNAQRFTTITTTSDGLTYDASLTTYTHWTPNTSAWLLNLYDQKFSWNSTVQTPPSGSNGSSVVRRYANFNSTNGFLNGAWTWDSVAGKAVEDCRLNMNADGTWGNRLTKTVSASAEPTTSPCPGSMPSVGTDNDAFGQSLVAWQNGQLLGANWINGTTSIGWAFFNVTRDFATGLVVRSKAPDSALITNYTYDSLGRLNAIDPPGTTEAPTFVCYDSPTQTTVYRAASQITCPVTSGASGVLTWQQYQYDGLGRVMRETRLQPDLTLAKRFTVYDVAGNAYFHSEWVSSGTSESLTLNTSKTVNGCTANVPSGAPGTFLFCYDPFGRPQGSVGPKFTSYVTTVRNDGAIDYSDTADVTTVACVNGTWSGTTCSGGSSAATTTLRDALGRTTSVTEPSGDVTSYGYNVFDRMTSVTQGTQSRTLVYDAFGRLKTETAPELGGASNPVNYVYGSLGNLREKSVGPLGPPVPSTTLFVNHLYEPAGRVEMTCSQFGASQIGSCSSDTIYVTKTYDSGCSTGAQPGCGTLGQSIGSNYLYAPAPDVTQTFTYYSTDGRLSQKVTSVGNGGENISATESWTYNNIGLVSSHNQPRTTGSYTISYGYGTDLPTSVAAASANKASSASYNPAGALKSWVANGAAPANGNVTTTIAFDASIPSRPTQISTSGISPGFNSGTYAYDGAGDVMSMTVDANNADTFTYDNRSRLMSASYKVAGTTSSESYTYDRFGNLLTKGATTFCTGSCSNNHIAGNTYDSRGNLTVNTVGTGTESLAYDNLDRETIEAKPAATWAYLYDADGERVAKIPAVSILRREMAKNLAAAKGYTLGGHCVGSDPYFTDIDCNDPDQPAIDSLYAHSISFGSGSCGGTGTTFCPGLAVIRGDMAVFIARALVGESNVPLWGTIPQGSYNCDTVAHNNIPANTSLFGDVHAADYYCKHVHYIYGLNITSGCGNGTFFCPTQNTDEVQMMAFLARAWPNYLEVPRGSIYTFRDQSNRVETELTSAAGGTSIPNAFPTATTVSRDNLFLGNLLVASNAASNGLGGTPGWSYYFSDHLGTPRLISGAESARPKYWPYGDEVAGTPATSERLKFATMERDSESSHFYDHARLHDSTLGRFVSVDKVGGHVLDPQSWNRYAYAGDNPLRFEDPNGKEKITYTLTAHINKAVVAAPNMTPLSIRHYAGGVKTIQRFTIETDPAKAARPVLPGQFRDTGVTHRVDSNGNPTGETGKASDKQIVAFGSRDSSGDAVVTASGSAGNPLNNPNPPITYDFTINAEPSGSTFTLNGTYGGFPSFDVTATNEEGQTLGVYSFDEKNASAGAMTLTGLFGGQQHVSVQCSFGKDAGCSQEPPK